MSTPFIGQIQVFGFNFPPRNYALCNGQLMSISQNAALFSLLGTTFGGNGQTTFGLPNLQGRTPIHFGAGAGLSSYALGQTGGEENHTLLSTEMPLHNHTAVATNNTADQTYPSNNVWATGASGANYSNSPNGTMAAGSVAPTGGGQGHPNMAPYLVINYSIALQGIFPSRN